MKETIFGVMAPIPMDEYKEIYNATGRLTFWAQTLLCQFSKTNNCKTPKYCRNLQICYFRKCWQKF